MKEKKYYLILWACTLFVFFITFLPFLLNHVPMTYGTDIKTEYFFYIQVLQDLVQQFFENGSLPFYSWTMFLGTSYLPAQSFYLNGDIIGHIALLFQNVNFFDMNLILDGVRFCLAASFMYLFLSEFNLKPTIKMLGSLVYAFSGWAIFFSGHMFFLTFYAFVPLYFWTVERYLQKHKKFLFVFSVALLCYINWYFFYTISLFTAIYVLYRSSLLYNDWKTALKDILIMIGLYLLGLGLVCFKFIPTVLYMMNNGRISSFNTEFIFQDIQVYLHQIASFFMPNYLYLYGNNVFETNWHVTREIALWATGLCALMPFQLFFVKEKRFKRSTLVLYAVLFVMLMVPMFDAAMQGFQEPSFRWTFCIIFINVLVTCMLLGKLDDLHQKGFKAIAVSLFILCGVIVPFTATKLQISLADITFQWGLALVCGAIVMGYGLLFSSRISHKTEWALVAVIVELIFFGFAKMHMFTQSSDALSYERIEQATTVLEDKKGQFNHYLGELDPINYESYYRIYVDIDSIYWNYSHNMNMQYDLKGLMIYMSTVSGSTNDLLQLDPSIMVEGSPMLFRIENPNLIQFLNTKYAVVLDESQLPQGISWKCVDENYRGSIKIYENEQVRSLGTTYSQVMTLDEYLNNPDLSRLMDTVIAQNQAEADAIQTWMKSTTSTSMEKIYYGGNQLHGEITSDADSFMVLTLPYEEGWKFLMNGVEVQPFKVSGGFIGLPVSAGHNRLDMYFIPAGFKLGCAISGLSVFFFMMILVKSKIKRKMESSDNPQA